MSDYRAIDADALAEELKTITDALSEESLSNDAEVAVDEALGNINSLIRSFDDPVELRDTECGYHLRVDSDK